MTTARILLKNLWQASTGAVTFRAVNPKTMEPLAESYPVSPWADLEVALQAATTAFDQLQQKPASIRADFLEKYASRLEVHRQALVEMAVSETGLPAEPRLNSNELPRTVDQLRQAAQAVRNNTWQLPTIDAARNIRSCFHPLGPVLVIGPNNFPFAYNSIAGGDFASAIAAGCPVLAKGHPAHPGTTRLLAEHGLPGGDMKKVDEAYEAAFLFLREHLDRK
jgi:NADP-dependent aldehyde dehydrogenase